MIALTESAVLVAASMVMSMGVIFNAYLQKQQFYPSVVYVTKSNGSMAIIYIQGLIIVLLLGKLVRKIFFGQLRTTELEHLIERSWYAVTETCLAFTVFRDDLSPKFVAMFTLLLFLKCFHWLAEDRVDYMERSPNISILFHIRVTSLLALLSILDLFSVYMAYRSTLAKGASVQLVFGFEYAILFAVVLNIVMKYILHFVDLYNENPWEDKAIYLLYTELIMGFIKIFLYLVFITIMIKVHTFPLFAIRPMYLTVRGFKKALNDVIMSRRAIRNMNTLYPNATSQDIENSDNVCIICRENMLGNGTCKKLPCNHIFHIHCLRSWFQRQQTCPTCRMDVLRGATRNAARNNGNINNNNNNINNNNNNPIRFPMHMLAPPMFMQQQFPQFFRPHLFQHQPQQQANQNNNNNNNAAAAATTATAAGAPNDAGHQIPNAAGTMPPIPPFFTAPMPPPPPPPMFPMPPMPSHALLQGFTDQELALMEGNERRNIEERLKRLNEVKTLIEAATIRLQQCNNLGLYRPNNSVATQTTPTEVNSAASTSSAAASPRPPPPPPQPNNVPVQPVPTTSASASTTSPDVVITNISNQHGYDDDDDVDGGNNEQEIIRQRRLQRFT